MGASPHPMSDEGQGPDDPKQITLRNNRAPAFVPLTGTSNGVYAIRPYPDGQKTRTGDVGRNSIRLTIRHGRARMPPINHPATQPGTHIRPLDGDI